MAKRLGFGSWRPKLSVAVVAMLVGCSGPGVVEPRCPERPVAPTTGTSLSARVASKSPDGVEPSTINVGTRSLTLKFGSTRLSNLVFQLDCMAGLYRCSRDDYASLWKKRMGWQLADDERLARWRLLRGRRGSLPMAREANVPYPLPFAGGAYQLDHRLRIAAFEATSLSELGVRLSVVTPHREWKELRTIAEHFMNRFAPFWLKEGAPAVAAFNREAGDLFRDRRLSELVDAAARFYAVDLGDAEVFLHAMFRPSLTDESHSTYGVQLGNHGIFEVVGGQTTVASRMPVVLHELFHYLHDATIPAQRAHLMQQFIDSSDPAAMIAYGLFDEAIATAMGNGVVAERVDKAAFARRYAMKNGLYGDEAVNTAAKAALPAVRRALSEQRPLDDPAFVAEYITLVGRALGPFFSPSAHLRVHIEVVAVGYAESARKLRRTMRSGSVWSFEARDPEGEEMLREFPKITALVFASINKGKLSQQTLRMFPAPVQPALRALAQMDRAFGYVAKRADGGHVIGIFGHDPSEADQVSKALIGTKSLKLGLLAVPPD